MTVLTGCGAGLGAIGSARGGRVARIPVRPAALALLAICLGFFLLSMRSLLLSPIEGRIEESWTFGDLTDHQLAAWNDSPTC